MSRPHPLRRISTGSLSSLARSQDRAHSSPSGLDFLQPALTELADEAATLAGNIHNLNELHDALGTFNESFAAYLYALKMNAFCVEWPLAPDENTFQRAPQLLAAMQQLQQQQQQLAAAEAGPSSPSRSPPSNPADKTYATIHSDDEAPPTAKPRRTVSAAGKRVAPGPTAAARKAALEKKKKREAEINSYIEILPLEYRAQGEASRITMEKVINKLMDRLNGFPMKDLVSNPDMPQAKVTKCLIALVAKKLVNKVNVGGATWYQWVGV